MYINAYWDMLVSRRGDGEKKNDGEGFRTFLNRDRFRKTWGLKEGSFRKFPYYDLH